MSEEGITLSFLSSLQVLPEDEEELPLDPNSIQYIENFNIMKQELAAVLFSLYNDSIFDNQLPPSLNLRWSGRLSSTAGYFSGRNEVIVLSSKIIKYPGILVCTLIHEMCHAAVRYIDKKVGLPPHGYAWRSWAIRARNIYPEIPRITVSHNFKTDYLDIDTIE